jgi:hypothetical protein
MESPIEMKIIKIEDEDYYVLSLMIEGASTLYEMGSLKNLMAFHGVIAQVSKTILDESLQFKSSRKKGLH